MEAILLTSYIGMGSLGAVVDFGITLCVSRVSFMVYLYLPITSAATHAGGEWSLMQVLLFGSYYGLIYFPL